MPLAQEMPPLDGQEIVSWFTSFTSQGLPIILTRLLVSIILFLIGRYLVSLLTKAIRRQLQQRDLDDLTVNFATKITSIIGIVIVAIIALGNLGIPMTSLIAFMGVGAIAVGLALQDTLANLASGLLIIMMHPYKEDDSIQVGEDRLSGTVDSVHFFHTVLRTADNSRLLVPNKEVMGNPIVNFTDLGWRRIDLEYNIGYDDDLRQAKQLLEEIAAADPRIFSEPATVVAVKSLGDSSVTLVLQPHVRPADYTSITYDLNERVKFQFDEAGISLAVPQRPVRLLQ